VKGFQTPFVGHPVQQSRLNAPYYVLCRPKPSDLRKDEGFVGKGNCPSLQL